MRSRLSASASTGWVPFWPGVGVGLVAGGASSCASPASLLHLPVEGALAALFLASHSLLIRSAADTASSSPSGLCARPLTMGMCLSCSISWVLRSRAGSGGSRPRSRSAAVRASAEKAFGGEVGRAGPRRGWAVEGLERGVNLVVSMRMMVRDLELARMGCCAGGGAAAVVGDRCGACLRGA
ncbi:hypothetical protein BJ912DRAFT_979890, partial [Pholiota molesta]